MIDWLIIICDKSEEMGKRRRAAKKVVKRVRPTVAKIFKCLFCNHEKAVQCKIDRDSMTGELFIYSTTI